jgi:CheY-like chemotaxis protein
MMPGVDGHQVLDHVRNSPHRIPVIVATAAVRHAKNVTFDPQIVKAVVFKPFEIEAIEDAITKTCGRGS